MNELAKISIVSTAEAALRKLKKAEIAVYGCKKEGASFVFSVKGKDVEKVFAIFDKPCYNVTVKKAGAARRFLNVLALRAGLFAGAAAFLAVCVFANAYVLKIEVSGSGSYLEPEIRRIVEDEGAGEFRRFSSLNVSAATGRILALPQVTFCNIEKRGSVLIVDVQTDAEHYGVTNLKPLVADRGGVVRTVVAICGTAVVSEGDTVNRSDTVIDTFTLSGEERISCLAVGYAELECGGTAEYFAAEENDESLKAAYASVLLEADEIIARKHTVKPTEGGFIYVIEYSYLHKISINMD
ncbi:MAG: sporulation protein YqfD [Clostridia bacterium]|nr:sporulation protein YqfD [Clostridia bacterium]